MLPPSPSTFLPATWPQVCLIFPFKVFHFSLVGIFNVTQKFQVLSLSSVIIFVTAPLISFISRDLTPDHESIYLRHTSLHQTRASSSSTFRASKFLKSAGLWVFGMVLDSHLLPFHGWNRLCIFMQHQDHSVTPPPSP